jgi:dipeptide transport system substrate-binding protein
MRLFPLNSAAGSIALALRTLALSAALAAAPAMAKTLVYCSEGSPENFYPGINTTGTSFDVTEQIYDGLVNFERGGTKVIPARAERWTVSKDGRE